MGCDIHSITEIKIDGRWRRVPGVEFGDRCYDSFAILADVRNGTGFAGCDTGDRFTPIAPPRGLPRDISSEARADEERFNRKREDDDNDGLWLGDHSFSHVTLAELEAVNWSAKRETRGTVSVDEFKTFIEKGRPNSWSGGVGGDTVIDVPPAEMLRRIAHNDWTPSEADFARKALELARYGRRPQRGAKHSFFTRVGWSETYAEAATSLHRFMIEKLRPLAADVGPENVRMVFGFDS